MAIVNVNVLGPDSLVGHLTICIRIKKRVANKMLGIYMCMYMYRIWVFWGVTSTCTYISQRSNF